MGKPELRFKAPAGAAWEAISFERTSRRIGWSDRRPHLQHVSSTTGLCLRVLEKGGQGVVTTARIEDENLQALADRALEIARSSPADADRRFGTLSPHYPAEIPVDDSLFSRTNDEILEMMQNLERKVLHLDDRLKKVVRFQWGESAEVVTLANSHAISLDKKFTSASFSVEILAAEGNETEAGWHAQSRRFAKEISPERMAIETAEETLRSLGGKPLPSGRYPVVVHPRVGAQLLELLAEAMSAEEVHLGRSFLSGRKGQAVASEVVTIIDDPFLAHGVHSAPFDDEGTPHEELTMVDRGNLADYFYDLRSASREKRDSNGHGLKPGLASPPSPQATNFYMKSGRSNPSDMLSSQSQVFLLREVMGLHMADPMTGEFSLGASGLLYEKGEFKRPVRGVTIAGTLEEVFKKIIAVGDDLAWMSSTGTPSFLISDMMIAGT